MPKYRVISEADRRSRHRPPRGLELPADDIRLITIVDAASLAEAAVDARDTEPHRTRRVTSVEELGPRLNYTDKRIATAIDELIDLDVYDSFGPQADAPDEGDDFETHAEIVAYALRESGLVPGLHLSMLANNNDSAFCLANNNDSAFCLANNNDSTFCMVEICDEVRDLYLSRCIEMRKLTDDRDAVSMDGAVAIARALIDFSNTMH